MQELEKILEEIKGLIEKHKNKAYELVAREPLTQCYTEADIEQIKVHELAVVRDIIRKHMTDGWIPVEERMPEVPKENPEFEGKKPELYLVTVRGTKYPFRAFWNGSDFTDGWTRCNVTAWCPLPEPYRPERNDGCSSCNHLYGIINLVWYLLM